MDAKYITQSFLILIIFGVLQLTNLLTVGIKLIKDNWSLYRCNPLIIPFAWVFGHDSNESFMYCAQNYNMNFMPYVLDPIKWMIGNLGNMGNNISSSIGGLINLGSSTNSGTVSLITNVYGIATNVLTQFQIIILGLKDTFSKIVGILVTFLYLLKGIEYAVPSALLTPPGKAIIWIMNTIGKTACNIFMPGGCG